MNFFIGQGSATEIIGWHIAVFIALWLGWHFRGYLHKQQAPRRKRK